MNNDICVGRNANNRFHVKSTYCAKKEKILSSDPYTVHKTYSTVGQESNMFFFYLLPVLGIPTIFVRIRLYKIR
jgi:hypothetical protein